jgi:hypothetical protein
MLLFCKVERGDRLKKEEDKTSSKLQDSDDKDRDRLHKMLKSGRTKSLNQSRLNEMRIN